MSNRVSGKVWELDLDPIDKLVLLALADHADHEGNNVRPGNDLLCAKTGLSERTVGKKIEKFIERGIIVPVRVKTGPGKNREFSLVTDQLPRHELFIKRDLKKLERASTERKRIVEPGSTIQWSKTVEPGSTVCKNTVEAGSTKQSKQVRPFPCERSNLASRTVEPSAVTVEPDDKPHDKERARALNPHEPSIEPSEREEGSPALSAIDDLANTLCILYRIPDGAGWKLKDKFQSLAIELHGVGATPAEIRTFYSSRQKKPGAEFFAGDFVAWRASQTGGASGGAESNRPPLVVAPPDWGRKRPNGGVQ